MTRFKTVLCCLGAAIFAASVSGSFAWTLRGIYDSNIYTHTDMYSKLRSVENVLKNNFLYEYDETKAADYAALGLSMSIDDPYTVYYNKEQFTEYTNAASGDFIGIGIVVFANKDTDEIEVESVMDDSPAFLAGVQPGDILIAIEGEKFTGSRLTDAVSKIRGSDSDEDVEGTSVTVTVRRNDEEIDLEIIRERIHEKTVKYEMLDDETGYMRISGFNTGYEDEKSTYDEFTDALADLSEKGMKKIIFDVRDNGGGDLSVVTPMVDRIVPEGLILYAMDKHDNREEIKSDGEELIMPMVVLVNGNTASAAELFAGALRDYDKAQIVGTTTYGKGVMQRVFPFSDGSGMTVTVAKYYTPDGICVQDEGITPDIICEQNEENKETPVSSLDSAQDVQLQKAIEILNNED